MRSLQEYLESEPRVRPGIDTVLTEEEFRYILQVAAPVFREASIRDAVPVSIYNDPGVLKSRHIAVVEQDDVQHGMSGTGGTFTRLDKSFVDLPAYAMWQNIEVPYREQLASERGGYFNTLLESGRAAGQKLVEAENTLIAKGLGPLKGISTATGIQTYAAGAGWSTQGQFWKDVIKARGKIKGKKIPVDNLSLLVHPDDEANAMQAMSNTAVPGTELAKMQNMLPGGIHTTTFLTAGKAYFYAKTPTVLELAVYQDLSVKALPMVDEDPRMRARLIDTLHVKSVNGICEVTGI